MNTQPKKIVPSNRESEFVRPNETVLRRWEGICTENGHHKWWAIVLVQFFEGTTWYTVRSAFGGLQAGKTNRASSCRIARLKNKVLRGEAVEVTEKRINEKRNLNRKRSYSYVAVYRENESGPIDTSNPPVMPAAKNPRLEKGLFAKALLGGSK